MMMSTWKSSVMAPLAVTGLVLLASHFCHGKVYMNVSPYPARVYENAPAGVPVLTVNAYDNQTGQQVTNFRLEKRGDSGYFRMTDQGIMETAQTVNKRIGYKFTFFVFAVSGNIVEWKHVMIEVSTKNLYPPTFTQDQYTFFLYRYTPIGTHIGSVSATDSDDDPHNKHFTIFATPNQTSFDYVTISSKGDITLKATPPEPERFLTLLVKAVDGGSPQRTGTSAVVIVVDSAKQPDTFCLSTTSTDTTLCWKNPMPGRDLDGFFVRVQGQGLNLTRYVPGDPDKSELCSTTTGMTLGQNYTFRVYLDTHLNTSGMDIELSFQKLGQGFSLDCVEEGFAACSFLRPCENGAECIPGNSGGLTYTCDCPEGWQGQNCTQEDLCARIPCQNSGSCMYEGHRKYSCLCPDDFFGDLCQHFNVCVAANPCQNGGGCHMHENGTYSCACPDYFSGEDCSVPDPCSPSPCGVGGECMRDSDTEASCSCYDGWYGPLCNQLNLCDLEDKCQHGGTCISTGNSTFSCACPPDFTGAFCDVFNVCYLQTCQNNSTCHMSLDGRYNCTCLPAYYGDECQHYDRCYDAPCVKGTCNEQLDQDLCTCEAGYHGQRCDQYDPCLADPCQDHGTCLPLLDAKTEEGELDYECQCRDPWWGLQCQNVNTCSLSVCQNGATCRATPPNTFRCVCPRGYYGSDCSAYNPCDDVTQGEELCQNGGTCYNTSSNSFWCDCTDGHFGERCERTDPCVSSPCLHGASCLNVSDTEFSCTCAPGFIGTTCEVENSCFKHPCENGGSCEVVLADGTGLCACPEGFLGFFCQIKDPCSEDGAAASSPPPCGNGACVRVNRTGVDQLKGTDVDVDSLFRCQCSAGYTGSRCDVAVSDCARVTCLNNGDCQNGVCVCPPGFTGDRCQATLSPCITAPCGKGQSCQATGPATFTCVCDNGFTPPHCSPVCLAEDVLSERTGRYRWPDTPAGLSARLRCPYGGKGGNDTYATRQCEADGQSSASWAAYNDSDCYELGLLEAGRRLKALKDLTSEPAALGSSEVTNITSILEELYRYTLMDKDVASDMMNVVSNLGDVNVSVTISSNQDNDTSGRLLKIVEDYTADVNVSEGSNVTITSPNFELLAVSVDNTSSSFTYVPSVAVDNATEQMDVSITIPPEALQSEAEEVTSQGRQRLQLIGHRKSQFYIPNISGYNWDELQHQPVLTAIVTGKRVFNLTSPVVYKIRNLQPESNYTCVFWDPENGTWSTEGVETTSNSGNTTECHAYHLTSFAVLLDPSPEFALSRIHEEVLTYISYIGCGVSLVCLVLTIVTYSLFRSLNKDKSGKILLNLCVALLLLNAVFLASGVTASGREGREDAGCTAVAVLLHYLLLASLAWMLVEAVEMYRALVTVFAKYAACYMLKRCLVGWGLPIVIVAITLGVDRRNYQPEEEFCFLSRSSAAAYYGSLVAPACLVLVVNTVIFVMVTRVILKPRFQQQKKEADHITPAQVRGAFTVMFLLGVTWVFGPLAIKDAKLVFNYLFCILNSLQGFLIFVFRCLFNPEARMSWVQLIKTGTLKKRRGPVPSGVYSDSSSKADHTHGKSYGTGTYQGHGSHGGGGGGFATNGSTTTTKTSLMHSNGSATTSTTKMSMMHSNGWHPKLNGYSSGQVLERRGTKFSTLDFYQPSVGSQNAADDFYARDGGKVRNDDLDNGHVISTMDYYDRRLEEGATHSSDVSGDAQDDVGGLGDVNQEGVLDYYETSHTSRTSSVSRTEEERHVTDDVAVYRARSSSSRSSSTHREERSRSSVKRETTNETDEFTYL
nr:hypothetical protein BaRGS_015839 [Batillaria attramentaria]